MIKYYLRTIKQPRLEVLEKFKVGSWIYVENPTEEEILKLGKDFKVEEKSLRDALDPFEVPRLEVDTNRVYVFLRTPLQKEPNQVITLPFLIIVSPDFLMTVSKEPPPFLEKFTKGRIDFYTTQKTKLFLQLFSEINSLYYIFLNKINKNVRAHSIGIEKIKEKDIASFVRFEIVLNDFLNALSPTKPILNTLLSKQVLELYPNDKELIEDLLLNNHQLIETCQSNLKNLVNIREAYETTLTHRLNSRITLLTILTIICSIPEIVSSFFGMNVKIPLGNHPLAFWEIFSVTLILTVILLIILIKKLGKL